MILACLEQNFVYQMTGDSTKTCCIIRADKFRWLKVPADRLLTDDLTDRTGKPASQPASQPFHVFFGLLCFLVLGSDKYVTPSGPLRLD
jgi:hypothetical protein